MDFGLHGGQHAYRPYAASLPVRVPTVKGLFPASFGLAARLAPHDFRSAVPYGYLHRSRQDRFILRESAHAGHTGVRFQRAVSAFVPTCLLRKDPDCNALSLRNYETAFHGTRQ